MRYLWQLLRKIQMKNKSFFVRVGFAIVILFSFFQSHAQILTYTSDTSGAYSTVAVNATGTPLMRVNGAVNPSAPCATGYSVRNFSTATTYASSLAAVEVDATPNLGYALHVTGFSAGLRISTTGPASCRFAFSTDGGTTWIDQGTNQTPFNGACGTTTTATWADTISVAYPNSLKFRIYGFNASNSIGNLQILNLSINGAVSSVGSGCVVPTLSDTVNNVRCYGGATGRVVVVATGGSAPFSYHWNTGATTTVITGLTAGTYVATVTATGGCSSTITAIVTQPAAALADSVTGIVNSTCSGTAGQAAIAAYGGTPAYTYTWGTIPVQTTATATGLAAGTYTFTVTDANTCTATGTATIGVVSPAGLSASGITSSGAVVHWSAVAGASSYNIRYRVSGTSTWTTVSATVDSITLTGLAYATTYEFQVQAVCSGSIASAFSGSGTFTTLSCLYPSGISATSITTSSALISWTAVSGATGYTLGYRISGTSTWTTVPVSGTSYTLTGLTPSTIYQYDVQTTCIGGGTSAYSSVNTFTTTATVACGTPVGLSATTITSSTAVISWTAVTGATSYTLQYKTAAGLTWTSVTTTSPTYTLTGLAFATTYQYKVAAVCPSGTSSYSAVSSFTTLTCLIPSGITVSSVTTTSALISWTAVSGATAYTVGYRVTGTSTWHDTVVTGTSLLVFGLTPGTSYDYDVQSTCAGGGTSTWSSVNTFTTATATGCSVPSGLTATSASSTSEILSWSAVTGAIGYHIIYRTTGGITTPPWTYITSSTNSVTLSGLTSPATYTYEVMAICSAADSSAYSSAGTFATITCVTPTGLTAAAVSTGTATISWTAVSGATGYNLNYRITGTTSWTTVAVTGSSYTLTGLAAGTTYDIEVQTVCSGTSTSLFSSIGSFTTLTASCGLPTGLSAASITTSSATLSWTAVTGAASYHVQYRPVGSTAWTVITATTNTIAISGLVASTTYEFQVQTVCLSGTSAYTGSTTFVTLGTCGVPSGLTATAITTTTATLNWTAVTGAVSYSVQYRASGTTTWTTITSVATSVPVSGLTAGTTYQFQVQTVCSGGSSGYSAPSLFSTTPTSTANKFLYYFTTPVDTSVRTGIPAVYLNSCTADTLVAYINRAKFTIDIAQYEYVQSTTYANIATAINNAYTRGVHIRWIYDGAATNTGLSSLNPAINKLPSPTTSAYGIMHNKFMVVDAKSTNPNDAVVWTGSIDWTAEHFNSYYNNTVIIQDSALAHAYLNEFNMMWGDTGIAPNATLAKFGPYKTNLGHHTFTISGKTVELYFSPSDSTNNHIQSTINSAATDLYFGMYTFTDNSDANLIVSRRTAGVYVAGIDDVFSTGSTAYSTLTTGLGAMFKTYTGTGAYPIVYHNKYCIADPSNTCSDPMVLTGSHNWSVGANTLNDENTLIIHDATAANCYYQAFHRDYLTLSGSLSHPSAPAGCSTVYLRSGADDNSQLEQGDISVFPNPTGDKFNIRYVLNSPDIVTIIITDVVGKNIFVPLKDEPTEQGSHEIVFAPENAGMYIIRISVGSKVYTGRLLKM
jgi:phosphatidylserine/phosphatidylglycerophosphate/cardiolipin synthase-like enzyme